MRKQVALGFLGTTLDTGKTQERWNRWRPTVALCQQPDLLIDRLVLFHGGLSRALAERITRDISQVSPETTVEPLLVSLKDPWDFEEVYGALHDVARAFPFDTDREDYLVNITTGSHVAQICLYLLTEARFFPARLIQLEPPKKWSEGGPGSYNIIDLDLSRYDRIAQRFQDERAEGTSFLKSGIETRNPRFNALIDQIEKVAIRSKAPLLLTGPTGAGKSQLARRIYALKKARHQVEGPLVEVNCATLRGDQAMSALFGHVKGAFTGAVAARGGLLRAADSGVLFLDEIGELGADEQAMVLRAVEEKRFLPVGADRESGSDFQLIAGTNQDLAAAVRGGSFREDLLARLAIWPFALPGLRARPEDIEPNLEFELRRHSETSGSKVTFNKEARRRYLAFATGPDGLWNANFRDLGASVLRMATLASGGRITEALVAEETARLSAAWRSGAAEDPLADLMPPGQLAQIDRFDRVQLTEVIKVCRDSKSLSAAGRRLFAVSRQERKSTNDADRLRKYLARFGLDWGMLQEAVG